MHKRFRKIIRPVGRGFHRVFVRPFIYIREVVPGKNFNYTSLKPRVLIINLEKINPIRIAKEHPRKFALFGVIFITIIVVIVGYRINAIQTNINLYPTTCLGGWENSQNAQGAPDVTNDTIAFSNENSALLDNMSAEIYCNDFTGNIPAESIPKKITLKFSWNISAESGSESSSESTPPPGEATSTEPSPAIPAGEATSTPPIEEINNSTPVETPASETPPEELPLSIFKNLENLFSSAILSLGEEVNNSTPVEEINNSTPTENSSSETPTLEEVVAPTENIVSTPAENDFLEVLYTLDSGVTWKSLGFINSSNWQGASFEIYDLGIVGWGDISKLQISIKSLPTIDTPPIIYLDSMYLEVAIEKEEIPVSDVFKYEINVETEYGTFRDAISSPTELTPEEVEIIKQKRVNNWMNAVKAVRENKEIPIFEENPPILENSTSQNILNNG